MSISPAARARFASTFSALSPEPSPQFSDAYSPSLTPPSRLKNPWRTPSRRLSGPKVSIGTPSRLSIEAGRCPDVRTCDRQRLEQGAHFGRLDQAAHRALEDARLVGRRRL